MKDITPHLALYWLGSAKLSAKKINALLSVYSPVDVWDSIDSDIFTKALGDKVVDALRKTRNIDCLEKSLAKLEKEGIQVVSRADEFFPERLEQREVDPPIILYCKGDAKLLKSDCISVIGARSCSVYGRETAEKLVRAFSLAGLTIVSGLATGIDGYAHSEAVNSGGKTIAVLGSGINNLYPKANIPLANKIVERGGLIVSEYPPETAPAKYAFPERNRIISGLSMAVVIVEASVHSGSIGTADFALEQGREVYAVPGNVGSLKSEGANRLIQKGHAKMIINADDVFEDLSIFKPEINKRNVIMLDFFEQKIYNSLKNGAKPFDELAIESKMGFGELSALLTTMEIKEIIKRLPSNFYSLK